MNGRKREAAPGDHSTFTIHNSPITIHILPVILAIETSCDDTAVAIYDLPRGLLASQLSSQIALHRPHGGVVPEVASRSHLEMVEPLIQAALAEAEVATDQIDAFAATSGPGLASSLLVGSSVAKGLAVATGKPYLAINHLEGHLLSPFLRDASSIAVEEKIPPHLGLIVSGGHTLLVAVRSVGDYQIVGSTLDDAAGEAFDKVAKMLELNYPGGPEIDRLARDGDPKRFQFPRSMLQSGDFNFSFSGLKTSVRYLLPSLKNEDLADICASFQEAVVDVLVIKTLTAAHSLGKTQISLSGGVANNVRLRFRLGNAATEAGRTLRIADRKFCADNAAMIAHVAALRLERGLISELSQEIDPNQRLA